MELIIVLACIAIVSGISAYWVMEWLPRARLRHAVLDLFSVFQAARIRAIRLGGEVAVVFSPGSGTYQMVSGGKNRIYDGTGAGNDDVVEKRVALSGYGSGIKFGYGDARIKAAQSGGAFSPGDEVTYIDDFAEFNARGMASKMGYVYVQNSSQGVCAVCTPTRAGVVSMKCWDGERWQ
jgi:Tfp pilus assembly protein FimT